MNFNRFDIVEAYYVYFVNFHNGQNSVEYKRLNKMLTYFTPRKSLRDDPCMNQLEDTGKQIYSDLLFNRAINELN